MKADLFLELILIDPSCVIGDYSEQGQPFFHMVVSWIFEDATIPSSKMAIVHIWHPHSS